MTRDKGELYSDSSAIIRFRESSTRSMNKDMLASLISWPMVPTTNLLASGSTLPCKIPPSNHVKNAKQPVSYKQTAKNVKQYS